MKERYDVYPQAPGQGMQDGQRGIGQAGLNPAHVRPEQAAALCQLFLCQGELGAQLLDAQTQRSSGIGWSDHP